jgi:hypothetical protein
MTPLSQKSFFRQPQFFKLLPQRPRVVKITLAWIWFDCLIKGNESLKNSKIDSAVSLLTQWCQWHCWVLTQRCQLRHLSLDSAVIITLLSFDSAVSLTLLRHGSRSYTKLNFHWLTQRCCLDVTTQFWLSDVNDNAESWLSSAFDTAESWLSDVISDLKLKYLSTFATFSKTILACESQA